MNTTDLPVRPDVTAFVARVRELLADLPEEDRLELTEGLEADLTDQVAESGGGALGDPEAYARELRTAAGLDPAPRRRVRGPHARSVPEVLDGVRAWWDGQVARPRVAPAWSLVAALRPVWWFFRAWIAAVLVCIAMPGYTPWGFTWLPGVPNELGLAVLAVCVLGSTLVGTGRVWPGGTDASSRGPAARVTLIGLNLLAVGMIPVVEQYYQDAEWAQVREYGFAGTSSTEDLGVMNRGQQVCNIAAYDAEGQPLVGVQLFDQAGRPLDVRCWGQQDRTVPWVLGDVTRWNVFPIGERDRPARTPQRRADLLGAAFPTPDRATTPAVTNPLVPVEAEVERAPSTTKDDDRSERSRTDGDVSRR
jgi:hypothetical protein